MIKKILNAISAAIFAGYTVLIFIAIFFGFWFEPVDDEGDYYD